MLESNTSARVLTQRKRSDGPRTTPLWSACARPYVLLAGLFSHLHKLSQPLPCNTRTPHIPMRHTWAQLFSLSSRSRQSAPHLHGGHLLLHLWPLHHLLHGPHLLLELHGSKGSHGARHTEYVEYAGLPVMVLMSDGFCTSNAEKLHDARASAERQKHRLGGMRYHASPQPSAAPFPGPNGTQATSTVYGFSLRYDLSVLPSLLPAKWHVGLTPTTEPKAPRYWAGRGPDGTLSSRLRHMDDSAHHSNSSSTGRYVGPELGRQLASSPWGPA